MKIALLQRANQADKAMTYADQFVKASRNNPVALVTRAGVELELKQDAKAQADLDAATAVAPNMSQANFYKAIIKARAHDAKGAWALAQTLPREFIPSRPDTGLIIGQMAIDAGQRETGTDILHNVVQALPGNADARIRLAQSYLALNEAQNAVDTLTPLQDSTDPRVTALLAQAYQRQKNYSTNI